MKSFFLILVAFSILFGCTDHGDRTEQEMLAAAKDLYENYLFELRISEEKMYGPKIESLEDGKKSYAWFVKGDEAHSIGITVLVDAKMATDPVLVAIGNTIENKDAWFRLINTARRSDIYSLQK